jgi:hypothetical protein
MLLPSPAELALPINPDNGDVEYHRNLYCPTYDHCLDRAVRQRWKSWTCVTCAYFSFRFEPARIAS